MGHRSLESLEPREEGLSHRIGSGFLRQALEAIKKMVENLGLDEQFGGFGVGSLDEKIAGDFDLPTAISPSRRRMAKPPKITAATS